MATAHKRVALIVTGVIAIWIASLRSASLSGERVAPAAQSPTFGVGHAPKPDQLKLIDIDVTPDGTGLVPGSGTAAKGKDVYTRRCETCHGPTGTEGPQEVIAGGKGSLATPKPQKTVGSYWPYATTVFDYIRRAMPPDKPGSLRDEEVYGLVAYLLTLNELVPADAVIDAASLPKVKMPAHDRFVPDTRGQPKPPLGRNRR